MPTLDVRLEIYGLNYIITQNSSHHRKKGLL